MCDECDELLERLEFAEGPPWGSLRVALAAARHAVTGGMSYLERVTVGLSPTTWENVRGFLVRLGGIAADAGEARAARFVDRRLAEFDTRHAQPGPEPLLSAFWIEELVGLMLSIRDGEPALNETARDWANGVLTVLDDMRRHPEAFV